MFVFGIPAIAVVLVSAAVTCAARGRGAPAAGAFLRIDGGAAIAVVARVSRLPATSSVVIVRDEAAASFYTSPKEFDAIIARGVMRLTAVGANVRVLSPAEARDDRSARVLVVPSSPCLTVATRETLELGRAVTRAGIILTGAAGTYDAGCRPLGYGLIVGATGASRAEALDQRDMPYVTFPSTSPLSADIPPGARLDLNPGKQIALRIELATRSTPILAATGAGAPSTARRRRADARKRWARRVVYWGFELTDIVNRPWDRAIARVARTKFRRVGGTGAGRDRRAVAARQTRGGIACAGCRIRVCQRAVRGRLAPRGRNPLDVLSHVELAERYERLSHRLAESGEIGTHGENHRLLGGLPSAEQRIVCRRHNANCARRRRRRKRPAAARRAVRHRDDERVACSEGELHVRRERLSLGGSRAPSRRIGHARAHG